MQFPTCRYASKEVEAGLRECTAPQLAGLKVVTPQLCLACVFRESQPPCNAQAQSSNTHTTQLLSDLFTCALQGERCSSEDEAIFACRHVSRETTTTAACRVCSDYLFPILSPELPVASAKRLLPVLNQKLQPTGWWSQENAQQAARLLADDFIRTIPTYPGGFSGRGIVIAGGGKYFVSTYVTVRVLRHVGCQLPIQIWHFTGEADENMRALLDPYSVEWINAETHPKAAAFRFHDTWWKGWQLKAFAILHCSFREILYLDADCYPVRDPSDVFDWKSYCEFGATFFPDVEFSAGLLPKDAPAAFGVPDFTDTPNESGQLIIHKEWCWRELNLALHYNQMPEFTYRHLWGDKDTFPLAWHRLGRKYARMWPTSQLTPQAILHFDQHHKVLFQHRAPDKFRLSGTKFDSNHQAYESNQFNPDLALEQFCHDACEELRTALSTGVAVDIHQTKKKWGVTKRELENLWSDANFDSEKIIKKVKEFRIGDSLVRMAFRPNTMDEAIFANIWQEYQIALLIPAISKHPATVVDLGGHIGSFTVILASLLAETQAEIYEFMPENCHMIQENLRLNGLESRVCVYNRAVGDRGDRYVHRYSFQESGVNTGGVSIADPVLSLAMHDVDVIPMISTKEIITSLDHVDILKVDCEASEFKSLFSLDKRDFRKIDLITGEIHDNIQLHHHQTNGHNWTASQLLSYLSQFYSHVTVHKTSHAEWGFMQIFTAS